MVIRINVYKINHIKLKQHSEHFHKLNAYLTNFCQVFLTNYRWEIDLHIDFQYISGFNLPILNNNGFLKTFQAVAKNLEINAFQNFLIF